MVVGGAIIVFDVVIPARLGLSMELSVGVMLVVLGALNLSGAWKRIEQVAHAHTHHHGHDAHVAHTNYTPVLGLTWLARPLLVGVVHGLAGSAAVALLVLTTIRSVQTALLYLAVFGLGTVVGMAVLTSAFAAPLAFAATKSDRINHYMARATGALSLAFGMLVLYKIGIVDGLFTSHPHWTPQ
jgi:high-affinity nickel-transport protein